MEKARLKSWLRGLLVINTIFFSAMASAQILQPSLTMQFKNAQHIKGFLNENAVVKDLRSSDLGEGLMLQLGQALSALPNPEQEKTWKGRLQDFFLDMILKDRPVSVAYFAGSPLSPFGIQFSHLDPASAQLAMKVLDFFRVGDAVEVGFPTGQGEPLKVSAKPYRIGSYRFSVFLKENCLALSRDPQVAYSFASQCTAQAPNADLRVSVNLRKYLPAFQGLSRAVFPVGEVWTLDAQFGAGRFVFGKSELAVGKSLLTGKPENPAEILTVLPSSTHFFTSIFLQLPRAMDESSLEALIASKQLKDPVNTEVVLFHLGTRIDGEAPKRISYDGFLLSNGQKLLNPDKVAGLFRGKHNLEVFARAVCDGKWIVVSPARGVLEEIEKTCAKSQPQLAQASEAMVQSLRESFDHRIFLNFPKASVDNLDLGWGLETKDPAPPEFEKARAVLRQVPQYFFRGQFQKDSIQYSVMTGAL